MSGGDGEGRGGHDPTTLRPSGQRRATQVQGLSGAGDVEGLCLHSASLMRAEDAAAPTPQPRPLPLAPTWYSPGLLSVGGELGCVITGRWQ